MILTSKSIFKTDLNLTDSTWKALNGNDHDRHTAYNYRPAKSENLKRPLDSKPIISTFRFWVIIIMAIRDALLRIVIHNNIVRTNNGTADSVRR